MVQLYKYSGAGNDFIVIDGRTGDVSGYRSAEEIGRLCDRGTGFRAADGRIGADGLMILSASDRYDFRMEYFNSDGSGGMMCGNGGRCIVAFADFLDLKPSGQGIFRFEAPDGLHTGEILGREGDTVTVKLKMIDVREYRPSLDGWFLDTGTRHFVRFVDDVDAVDVGKDGRAIRWTEEFAPAGVNANFVSPLPDGSIAVRTYEKGVEAETLACGTGITASAIAAYLAGVAPSSGTTSALHYDVMARGGRLAVDFVRSGEMFTDVYLTGPATLVR